MKIDPQIKRHYLHEAAVEQLRRDLERQDYVINRTNKGSPDVIARRGDELVAYEIKVLGQPESRSLTDAMKRARELGALFRLMVVTPDDELKVDIDGLEPALLEVAQRAAPTWPDDLGLNETWSVQSINDIGIKRVAVHLGRIEVEGIAGATIQMGSDVERIALLLRQNSERLTTLVRFRLFLGADGKALAESVVEPVDD